MTPDELAVLCAEAMWTDDAASRALGMRLDSVGPGRARVSMPITSEMVNGHGTAHGGFAFALADSAFAFACNSRNERNVAYACDIVYAAPVHAGDLLVATAVERLAFGRNGIYDVTIRRGDEVVAEFRGRCRTIGRAVLDPGA